MLPGGWLHPESALNQSSVRRVEEADSGCCPTRSTHEPRRSANEAARMCVALLGPKNMRACSELQRI